MVYQYDKPFGYGCWMTSSPAMSRIFIFLGYSKFPIWLPWQPIQILQYPKSIQQNIKLWDMVGTLVIQQVYHIDIPLPPRCGRRRTVTRRRRTVVRGGLLPQHGGRHISWNFIC